MFIPVYGSTWQWDCRPDWRCKCLKEQALDIRIRHQVKGKLLLSGGQGELSRASLSSSTRELELLKGRPRWSFQSTVMGKCPETATCYLSANASPYLHFPQVFFSYTVSLGCCNQIKDFPKVFLNVPPSKLSLFQQNKTQFSLYYSRLIFPRQFSHIFPPSTSFSFLFLNRFRVEAQEKGRDLPQFAWLPLTKVSIGMKIQELIAGPPAPNPGPPLLSVSSPLECSAQQQSVSLCCLSSPLPATKLP